MPTKDSNKKPLDFNDIVSGNFTNNIQQLFESVDESAPTLSLGGGKLPGVGTGESILTGTGNEDSLFQRAGAFVQESLGGDRGKQAGVNRALIKELEAYNFKEGVQNVDLKGALSDTEGKKLAGTLSALNSLEGVSEDYAIQHLKRLEGVVNYMSGRVAALNGGRLKVDRKGNDLAYNPQTGEFEPAVWYLDESGVLQAELVEPNVLIPKFYTTEGTNTFEELQSGIQDLEQGSPYLFDGSLYRKGLNDAF